MLQWWNFQPRPRRETVLRAFPDLVVLLARHGGGLVKISPWIVWLASYYYFYVVGLAIIVATFDELATDFWTVLLSQGAVFMALIVYAVVLLLRPRGVGMGWLIGLAILLAAIVNIVCHGFIYSNVGLFSAVAEKVIQPDLMVGLYFSIVTFTTLGYGDYTPMDGYQLVSALQALYGYVFLGSLVGLAIGTVVNR